MARTGIRAFLLITAVGYAALVTVLAQSGRAALSDDCLRNRVVQTAVGLSDAGQLEAARELLTEHLTTVASGEAKLFRPSVECLEQAFRAVGQQTFSDQVVDGAGAAVTSIGPFQDLDSDRSSLSDGAETTIRFLLWFLPTLLGLLGIRELVITRLDRRPGPVEVTKVSISGDDDTSDVEAELARALKGIDLNPSRLTPGSIGEIVIPVLETSEGGGGAIATAASLAKQLVLPKSGFELDCHFTENAGKHHAIVIVRTTRDGRVLAVREVSGVSREAVVGRAATVAYFEVHNFAPIRRRTASWSLWSDPEALAAYIELPERATSQQIRRFVDDEPGNLAVRLRYASQLVIEGERELVADRPAHIKLMDATQAAAAAVRRAPRLVEPRAQLAITLALSPFTVAGASPEQRAASRRTRRTLRDLARSHPRVVLAPLRLRPRRWAKKEGLFSLRSETARLLIARGVCRSAIWGLRAPATWWRFATRPRLRRSIPVRALLPFERSRRASIHNLKSILIYTRLRRYSIETPTFGRFWTLCDLRVLRMRHWLIGDLPYQTYTRYNLLLCYALLGDLHKGRHTDVERHYERHLRLVHFNSAYTVSRRDVAALFDDIDLKPRANRLKKWLQRTGLVAAIPSAEPEADWGRIANGRVEAWRAHLRRSLSGGFTPQDRFDLLISLETALQQDRSAVTGQVEPSDKVLPPALPTADLERVEAAILDDGLMERGDVEEISRTRLRMWTEFRSALDAPLSAPSGVRANLPAPP